MTLIKRSIPIFVFLMTILTLTSCDNKEEIIETLSESEAVELIEAALQSNVGGLTTNLEDLTEQLLTAVTSGELCDTTYTDTIEKDRQGVQIQANYTSELAYAMTCNNFDIPQTATFAISTNSTYTTPRIESDDAGDFAGNATGLQPSSSTLTVEGNNKSSGTQELDFMEQKNISSVFEIELTSFEMNKQDYHIESGNATFLLTGSTQDDNFSYGGSLLFNGNNTATIDINGTIYEIDWN